jgi:3',5'-cyclic-AMP phosphodiesterase
MTRQHKSPHTPTKLLWLTDLHLDRAAGKDRTRLLNELSSRDYDAAVVSGDTGTAANVCDILEAIAAACHPRVVYFVLGNHDFYGAPMSQTYDRVASLCRSVPNLRHLQDTGPISLDRHTALVGHHGWADARCGWGRNTVVNSPDHSQIPDFRKLSHDERYRKMEQLGRQSASAIRTDLVSALRYHRHVVIATHTPAFPTSALYDGKLCGPCHQPHYVNLSVGAMLIGIARRNNGKQLTVLSGHTHHSKTDPILKNLHSHVGGARTGIPEIQQTLEFQ